MLGTNRTYLSQIINEQTKQTFTQFVNGFRTKEAVRSLSDPDNQTPLKAISAELGFNSMTTVYNHFLSPVLLLKQFCSLYCVDSKLMHKILNYSKNRLSKYSNCRIWINL